MNTQKCISYSWDMYPRPQLVRDSFINLNGEWDFFEGGIEQPEEYNEKILVPFPMESELSGIHRKHHEKKHMWYRRTFTIDNVPEDGHVLLHCGGVDRRADIWINGRKQPQVLSFLRDTTELYNVKPGENEIILRVYDNILDKSIPYGKQSNTPAGMWYTPVSGVWQTIWIEKVPDKYISDFKIKPRKNGVDIRFMGIKSGVLTLESGDKYRIHDGEVRIRIQGAHLWTPEDPYLYRFTVKAGEDSISSYFAIRTVDVREIDGIKRICLNGKPYFMHGLLDQGYWPDGIYTPKTPQAYADDIINVKKLGFNMLRKHIKVEPDIFYYLCDKLGMLVCQDMVNNGDYKFLRDTIIPTFGFMWLPDYNMHKDMYSRILFYRYSRQTVKRLYNHPSIVYWTIFNEGWGQFHSTKMYEEFKKWDPFRIIDSTSGWFKCGKSDVSSWHIYFHKFIYPIVDKPVMLSEFGGYALKVKGHTHDEKKLFGYAKFNDTKSYGKALLALYRRDVIDHIPDGLCGAVYTQISDVETEENGLFTYDREICKLDGKIAEQIKTEIELACI